MNIFEKLTDLSLRRLYKFILKRAISSYLDDELLIEQLQVNSRDGLVTVTDLVLDSSLLNKQYVEPSNLPFKITKACIKKLDAKISYNVLLANGFKFNIYDLEITIEPITVNKTSPKNKSDDLPLDKTSKALPLSSVETNTSVKSNEGDFDGTEFIANWIEVIIASLQIKVHNIIFIIEDVSKEVSMKIHLNNLTYYNGNVMNHSTLSDLNESFLNTSTLGQSFTASTIHSVDDHKILTADEIVINVMDKVNAIENNHEILKLSTQIKLDIINKQPLLTQFTLSISSFQINLNILSSLLLMKIVNTFVNCQSCQSNEKSLTSSPKFSNNKALNNLISIDPNVGAILWLEEQYRKNKSNIDVEIEKYVKNNLSNKDDINYEELINNMKKYHQLKLQSNIEETSTNYAIDDDMKFPLSDDNMNDDLLFETCIDIANNSTINLSNATNFRKTIKIHKNSNKSKPTTIFSLDITTFQIQFSDIGYNNNKNSNLYLNISNLFVKYNNFNNEKNNCSITIKGMNIYEDALPILTFASSTLNAFRCNIVTNNCSEGNNLKIELFLNPLILSLHMDSLLYWTNIITFITNQIEISTVDSSTLNTSITAKIETINLLVHTSPKIEFQKWEDFMLSLDIYTFPDSWVEFPDNIYENFYEHLNVGNSKGGIRICGNDISLSYQSNKLSPKNNKKIDKQRQLLSMTSLDMSLYLKIIDKHLESSILNAFTDLSDSDSRVVLSIGAPADNPNPNQMSNVRKEDDGNDDDVEGRVLYGDDDSLPVPLINQSSIIHVYAYRIHISMKHREYCALITLSEMFIITSNQSDNININLENNVDKKIYNKVESKIDGKVEKTLGFGLILHANISTIRLFENSYEYSYNNLNPSKEYNSSPSMVSMSVVGPLIEMYSVNNQTFFSIQATDISLFEMTTDQYNSLNNNIDSFDPFINSEGRNIRVGNNKYLIPFLHSTTLHKRSGRWELIEESNLEERSDKISKVLDHIFRLQILLVDSLSNTNEMTKNISIHMSFQDVTIRYDPLSTWLFKVVSLLTPLTTQQILTNRNIIPFKKLQLTLEKTDKNKVSIYEVTNVIIRIRKCLIDYCCESLNSRLLFSIGVLKLSSRIITNHIKFAIKFSVRDISLYISNILSNNPLLEQSPIDLYGYRCKLSNKINDWIDFDNFLDSHRFIQLLSLDYIENNVIFHDDGAYLRINNKDFNATSMKLKMGLCSMYACMDSLDLLIDTINVWWSDFKIMNANSEKKPYDTSLESSLLSLQESSHSSNNEIENSFQNDIVQNITTIFDYDNDSDDKPTKRSSFVEDNEVLKPIETKSIGWLDSIKKDAFTPITTKRSSYSDNLSDRSMSPELQGKWLPQYTSDDEVDEDIEEADESRNHFLDDKNDDLDQYSDEYDNNNDDINKLSDIFSTNNRNKYSSIDGIQSKADAVHDSVLIDDLLHTHNDNILSNDWIDNEDQYEEYNPKNTLKFKYTDDDNDDNNNDNKTDNWGDLSDGLFKSDENVGKETTTNIFGHKSLTEWSKSISKSNNLFDYELNEYTNNTNQNTNKLSFLNNYIEDDLPLNDNYGDMIFGQVYQDDMNKSSIDLSTSINNIINSKKDYERFDSIDGVHNALQITINDKITIRKAGQVVKEEINNEDQNEMIDDIADDELVMIDAEEYKIPEMIQQSNDKKIEEVVSFDEENNDEDDKPSDGVWFQDMKTVKIEDFYIPTKTAFVDPDDDLPEIESKLPVITYLKLSISIKLKLFGGCDWKDSTIATTFKPKTTKPIASNESSKIETNIKDKKDKSNEKKSIKKDALDNNKLFNDLVDNKKTKIYDQTNIKVTQLSTTRTLIDKRKLEGKDIPNIPIVRLKTRQEEDMIDISAMNISVCLRIYDTNQTSNMTTILPIQRISLRIQDMLISFERIGHRKKKVIGWWKSYPKPRIVGMPFLHATLIGYPTTTIKSTNNENLIDNNNTIDIDNLEHRVVISMIPLRCFLDPYLIDFLKSLGQLQDSINQLKENVIIDTSNKKKNSNLYFQMIIISSVDMKIDYTPSEININALQAGDYLQILNLFPLEELVITLKQIKLHGILGLSELFEKAIEQWVDDIYQNQIYRVITGTTPLRGLANISSDLHDLFVIPMKEYQLNKQINKQKSNEIKLLYDIKKKSTKLLKTFLKETLNITQKITMVVARGIVDLVSDGPNEPIQRNKLLIKNKSNNYSNEKIGNTNNIRSTNQPNGLKEGLSKAYESISREMTTAVDSVILLPIREFRRTGSSKVYVKEVIRALPIAILRPVAGAAEGLSYTLLGLRNLIDPTAKIDEEDVWNVDTVVK